MAELGLGVRSGRFFRHSWPNLGWLCRIFRVLAGGRFDFFDTDPAPAARCVEIVQSRQSGTGKVAPPDRRL